MKIHVETSSGILTYWNGRYEGL